MPTGVALQDVQVTLFFSFNPAPEPCRVFKSIALFTLRWFAYKVRVGRFRAVAGMPSRRWGAEVERGEARGGCGAERAGRGGLQPCRPDLHCVTPRMLVARRQCCSRARGWSP